MGIMAAIIGTIGALCAVVGIFDAADMIPADIGLASLHWQFWFSLAGILLLGTIALLQGRGPSGD